MPVQLRRFVRHSSGVIGLCLVAVVVLTGILAPWLVPRSESDAVNLALSAQRPSAQYPLGTDEMGRDVLSRVIAGSRISLTVAVSGVLLALLPGIWIGLLAGYYEGPWGATLMRGVDALIAFPRILLAMVIISIAGPGIYQLMAAVGLSSLPVFARVMYTTVLTLRKRDFVVAAHALGAKDWEILRRHVLPNALSPMLVQASLGIATALQIAAGLSFLGLGPPPPSPEWGAIIDSGRTLIRQQPMVIVAPGAAIALTTLGFNLLGDGLRDVLDPRLKG